MNAAPTKAPGELALSKTALLRHRICTPGALILSLSSFVAIVIFFIAQAKHFSDSNTYFLYSVAMSAFSVNPGTYFRTAGYPTLLAATLYPWTKSVLGVLAVQAALAALIPYVVYRIVSYVAKPLAAFAALLSIATLLPYLFEILLYPDQVQLFLNILFCYALIRYWFDGTPNNMIWLFVVCACIAFFRPTFSTYYLLLPLVVGIAMWSGRKEKGYAYYLKPFAALSIALLCLHGSILLLDSYLYAQTHQERNSINGKTVFLNSFVNSVGVKGAFDDGEYTNILRDKLIDFFHNAPPELTDIRELGAPIADRFIQYQSDPERMVDAILRERTVRTYSVLFNISERYFGKAGDSLFMHVALEQYRLHPEILWNVLKRGFAYYSGLRACEPTPSGRPLEYSCDYFFHAQPSDQYIGYPQFGPYTGMAPYTARLLGRNALSQLEAPFTAYATTIFPSLYRAVILLGGLLTGAGLLFCLYGLLVIRGGPSVMQREQPVLCGVTGVYLMYVAPMIILAEPEFRYVSAGALFLLMSGLLSLRMLFLHGRTLWGSGSSLSLRGETA
jgi:hypothetical protein